MKAYAAFFLYALILPRLSVALIAFAHRQNWPSTIQPTLEYLHPTTALSTFFQQTFDSQIPKSRHDDHVSFLLSGVPYWILLVVLEAKIISCICAQFGKVCRCITCVSNASDEIKSSDGTSVVYYAAAAKEVDTVSEPEQATSATYHDALNQQEETPLSKIHRRSTKLARMLRRSTIQLGATPLAEEEEEADVAGTSMDAETGIGLMRARSIQEPQAKTTFRDTRQEKIVDELYYAECEPEPEPVDTKKAGAAAGHVIECEGYKRVAGSKSPIFARNLDKYYGSLHALKQLTFDVQRNECFGLLGINGSGKSTTFGILAGLSLCSRGKAKINGGFARRIRVLGYCPQCDALMGHLTVRETLWLMTALRGYKQIRECVAIVLDAVDLLEKADKLVSQCSGGERRQLSIALALISQSQVILLDEPTAGIDPKTRRKIWDLLNAMRGAGCAILLASNSMEECEALCTRIGILRKGAFIVIDIPRKIKSRFGEGCAITLTLRDEGDRNEVINAMSAAFPRALLGTSGPSIHLVYYVRRSVEDRWSRLFGTLDRFASAHRQIVDYSLAETHLEEALLRLSGGYEDIEEELLLP